jgi:thiol-disulfide isomerase/thioredoxin
MKIFAVSVFSLVLLFSFVGVADAQSGTIQWNTDPDEAFEIAREEGRPVLLVITGGVWCDPCRWFDENTLGDPALVALVRSGWVPLRLMDTDGAAIPWSVQKLPTVIMVEPDGREIERFSGMTPATVMRERLISSAPSGGGRRDNLNGAVFRIASGMIWNDGGAMWYTQDAGLPPRLEEYDRDDDFLYLQDRPSATVLAITLARDAETRSLWRWDRQTGDWVEVGPLNRTN